MAMLNPCHPGEILRDNLEAAGLSVIDAAARLGCTRQALSRLLNGKAGISPAMALALERIGWSNASFWMRLQAAYELAQERRRQAA
jgi:addiction module HigA family antidote